VFQSENDQRSIFLNELKPKEKKGTRRVWNRAKKKKRKKGGTLPERCPFSKKRRGEFDGSRRV